MTRALAVPRAQLLIVWLACGFALERFTGRVTDWFVMTDELLYERLAISVARTGSPLPQLHGTIVNSVDQLYPLILAPFFVYGSVHGDLVAAHVFGAFLMSSACVPAFLLARDVSSKRWVPPLAAFLTVAVPWMVYSAFLLTEVAAYPAFVLALLGMERCLARPSARSDALALAGIGLAFLVRTQFIVLVLVLPLALVAFELGAQRRLPSLRRHRILSAAYAFVAVVAVVLLAVGRLGSILGAYGSTLDATLLPPDTGRSMLQHLSTLALGLGIIPALIGGAWLTRSVTRGQEPPERRAFACVSLVAIVLVTFQVSVYDLRLGAGLTVYDRYLFYLAPALLVATLCAVTDRRLPTMSLVLPTALVAAGFALDELPPFQWSQFETLDPNSPVAGLYRPLVHFFGSLNSMRAGLALLTIFLGALLVFAARMRPSLVPGVVVGVLIVTIPLATWYDVHRLITTGDWAVRPLTGSSNGTAALGWVDGSVGARANVTEIPYPVSRNYLVNSKFWRDLEFWNKSVQRQAQYPSPSPYAYTGNTFPKLGLAFDPVTGRSTIAPTPYVVQSVTESRFQIAGNVQRINDGAMLIDATKPWRLAWATTGPYDDGWLRPHVPARIRVYAIPGQARARTFYVSLQIWAPDDVSQRAYVVRSNLAVVRGVATGEHSTFVNKLPVCVPPGRYSTVTVRASDSSTIPGSLSGSYQDSTGTRQGSVFLADTSVSDDVGGPCVPSARQP